MKKYLKRLNLVSDANKTLINVLDSSNKNFKHCIFYNTHSYIETLKDFIFIKAVLSSNYVFADGIGVSLASKIFLPKKINRVTGYDFFEKILNEINQNHPKKKLFFFGGDLKNLQILKKRILINHKNISPKNIEFFSPPFGNKFEYKNDDTINLINKYNPDILFVGLGAPKQEKWVHQNYKNINCKNFLSIGAAFNFFTGLEIRAPLSMRKYGLEWLFRLIISPKKIYKRVFISGVIFIFLTLIHLLFNKSYYKLKFSNIEVRLIKDFKKFHWNQGYILSALNLASLSFLYKKDIIISKKIYFWGDGIFHKLMIGGSKKTAGRDLIKIINPSKEVNTLHVIGNLTQKTKEYLQFNFSNLKLKHTGLPYGNVQEIYKKLPIVQTTEIIFLTLPTPKQEQIANYLHAANNNLKIVCIGGGLAIAAGDETEVPKIFDYFGLEWLWRLRYETKRRLNRLIVSAFYMFKYLLYGRFVKKIIVKFL